MEIWFKPGEIALIYDCRAAQDDTVKLTKMAAETTYRVFIYVRLGVAEEASRAYRSALAIGLEQRHFANAASASTNLAVLLANSGQLDQAIELLKNSLEYLEKESFPDTEMNTRSALIQLLSATKREPLFAIETARALFSRFRNTRQAEATIPALERIIARHLQRHPELDEQAWKAQQFPTIFS